MTDRLVDKTRRSLKLAPSSPESTGRLHFSFFFFRRVSRRRLFKIPDLAALMAATRSLQWEILTWTVALLRYNIEIYMEEKARFTLADEKKKKDDEGSEGGKKNWFKRRKRFPLDEEEKKRAVEQHPSRPAQLTQTHRVRQHFVLSSIFFSIFLFNATPSSHFANDIGIIRPKVRPLRPTQK